MSALSVQTSVASTASAAVMNVMIRTLTLLGLFAFPTAIFGCKNVSKEWTAGLHYKFDPFRGFHQLPLTIEAATKQGYVPVEGPTTSSGFGTLTLYVKESQDCLLIGIYFDECNLVAGLQINIPQKRLNTYYNAKEQGFIPWCHNDVEYYVLIIYFVSEDAKTRRESCDATKVIRAKYVTVTGVNGELTRTSVSPDGLDGNWTKQACVMMMGQHYQYNMTSTTTCDKPFQTFFPLYDLNACQLIGVGVMWIGNTTCDCETPTRSVVEMIVPNGPQCLYELVEAASATTLHVYFNSHPRLITC